MEKHHQTPEEVAEKPVLLTDLERESIAQALYSTLIRESQQEAQGYFNNPQSRKMLEAIKARREGYKKLVTGTLREQKMSPAEWIRCGIPERVTPEQYNQDSELNFEPVGDLERAWFQQIQYYREQGKK